MLPLQLHHMKTAHTYRVERALLPGAGSTPNVPLSSLGLQRRKIVRVEWTFRVQTG
jgi:hypothetical protein